jgi:hypothetical protein
MGCELIRRRPLHVIDHQNFDRAFGRNESQAQLLLHGGEDVGAGISRCGADTRLIQDYLGVSQRSESLPEFPFGTDLDLLIVSPLTVEIQL